MKDVKQQDKSKFLADENITPRVVKTFKEAGFATESIYDVKLQGASDEKIITFAKKNNYIIITHDKDFGNLLHSPDQSHAWVILFRSRRILSPFRREMKAVEKQTLFR